MVVYGNSLITAATLPSTLLSITHATSVNLSHEKIGRNNPSFQKGVVSCYHGETAESVKSWARVLPCSAGLMILRSFAAHETIRRIVVASTVSSAQKRHHVHMHARTPHTPRSPEWKNCSKKKISSGGGKKTTLEGSAAHSGTSSRTAKTLTAPTLTCTPLLTRD